MTRRKLKTPPKKEMTAYAQYKGEAFGRRKFVCYLSPQKGTENYLTNDTYKEPLSAKPGSWYHVSIGVNSFGGPTILSYEPTPHMSIASHPFARAVMDSWQQDDQAYAKYTAEYNGRVQTIKASEIRDMHRQAWKGDGEVDEQLLGCSVNDFQYQIYSLCQFYSLDPEAYGRDTWHLDHVKPLCSYDLTDPEQYAIAAHCNNVQPMDASENILKLDK